MEGPPPSTSAQLRGRCHCGNLTVAFGAARPISELGARACTCTFCAPRRLRWTSDPDGRVEIVVADDGELNRYRFGTGTADFLVCRRCGQVIAAVSHEPEPRAVVNVDLLERAGEFGAAEPRDFDGEDTETRLARRARNWTPARVRLVVRSS